MQYLIFTGTSNQDALSQFQTLNNQINLGLGYPNGGTLTYSDPIYCQNPNVYKIAMIITSSALPFLSDLQKSSLIGDDQLKSGDFFKIQQNPS